MRFRRQHLSFFCDFFSLCLLCCICVPLFFSRFHECYLDFAWSLDSVVYWIIPLPCACGTLLPIFCYIGFMLSNIIVHTICECFIYSFMFLRKSLFCCLCLCFYVSWVCVLLFVSMFLCFLGLCFVVCVYVSMFLGFVFCSWLLIVGCNFGFPFFSILRSTGYYIMHRLVDGKYILLQNKF